MPDDFFGDPRRVIKKVLQIIRSRWLIGLFAAVIVGAGVGAVLFRFRPIEFTAETTMLAQSPLDRILDPTGASPGESDRQESILTDHLSVMISRMFRQRLADSFTPAEKLDIQLPYLKKGQETSPSILMTVLAKKITVTREREKDFFTIQVKHVSAPTALLIANHFTATYLQLVQSELHRANQAAADILSKQALALANEISAIEDQRREYRSRHNLISVEENQVILEDRIKQVNLARADLRVQRAKLEAEVRQAGDDLAKSPLPFTNAVLSAYPGMQVLRQDLDTLLVHKDVLAIRYGPKHALMVEVDGSIAATRNALARNYRDAFLDLKSQLNLAVAAEKGLNVEFDAAFNDSLELSRLAGRLNALAQQAENKRKTLDDLFQRIGKAAIDTGLPADVLRVVDTGYLRYSFVPMIAVYIALIAMFSLGAFVLAPLTINFFDERVHENIDFDEKLQIPVLGVIPQLSRTRKMDRAHIVRDGVDMISAEAFLSLANRIDLISKHGVPRRILVTSTLPVEGKSIVASNLATAYTRLGRRTVLVDCDFRRPSQRTLHQIGGDSGLLRWARAGFHFDPGLLEAGHQVNTTALADGTFLIPAGASDPQPGRYLIADGMARFFALLRQEFEIIIVDTPPAGVFQDALILARYCDDTILVARDGRANLSQLTQIAHDFSKTASPAVGIVLNGFSARSTHPQIGLRQLYRKYGYYAPASRKVADATM